MNFDGVPGDGIDGFACEYIVEVGGPGTLAQSVAAIRAGGHIALIGVLTGFEGVTPTMLLMAKQARIEGLIVGSRRQQQDYVAALEHSGIHPIIELSRGSPCPILLFIRSSRLSIPARNF